MKFAATTAEVCAEFRTSPSTIRRLRIEGTLRPGVHFIAAGVGQKTPRQLRWSLEAVETALAKRARQVCAA
jgi:hypothetical protein